MAATGAPIPQTTRATTTIVRTVASPPSTSAVASPLGERTRRRTNSNNPAEEDGVLQQSNSSDNPGATANFAQHPINLPPMTITKAPILISATLLHEPWTYELFQHNHRNSCQLSYLCCPLLHFSRQLHTIDPRTYTGTLYNCIVCLACITDVLTLRSPLACYPGLGTALFGWYARLHIRLKYRIAGVGVKDLFYTSCCSNYAAQQHFQEFEKEGVGYPVPGGSWRCCLHHTGPRPADTYTYSPLSGAVSHESSSLVNHRPH